MAEKPKQRLPQSDPRKKPFTPAVLDKTVIALPLLARLAEHEPKGKPVLHPVIIDLNIEFRDGLGAARERALREVEKAIQKSGSGQAQGLNMAKSEFAPQYLFGALEAAVIRELVRLDASPAGAQAPRSQRALYRIWPDFEVRELMNRSVSTVKVDAARTSFAALGKDIVWAVMDSGIDCHHRHFVKHKNLELDPALKPRDFTAIGGPEAPLEDPYGHGTHVAGIIGGEVPPSDGPVLALARHRDEDGEVVYQSMELPAISGMAPQCKLLSLRVLDRDGKGTASNLIAAIGAIQEINGHGRRIRVQGVNMSVGYDFEPEWFACGQSPLCVEVDRLVRSGVIVVVAAGNTGYGYAMGTRQGNVPAGIGLTINDPGNSELAITVGSTHRDMPHVYGVSYFSSKGPTGDGRPKPDLVAPGEKILSAGTGNLLATLQAKASASGEASKATHQYVEDSGTSMAAPHVSGVIAAFLSVRREFIGRPETVKKIFTSTATDLARDRYFQGHGLVDLMRAIQSV